MSIFLRRSIYALCKDSLFFFLLSLVVLIPFNFLSDKYTQEIETIIEEHMAPLSLAAMLVIATSITSLTLRFVGSINVKKKYNKLIYTLIIFPVIKVGKAYASTMVGMMTGLTLILSFSEGISKTIMPLFFIVCISMYWFLFEAILYVSKNGLPSNVSKKTTNILLLIIVIIIPAVYFYIV